MDHGPRQRTAIPRLGDSPHVFSEAELADYLIASGVRVVEVRGNLWRNSYAPSPISRYAWTPLNRWVPLTQDVVGYPTRSALAYRARAAESVPTRFSFAVFRDLSTYGEHSMNRHRARDTRKALQRYEYRRLDSPDLLLAQGWQVMRDAFAFRGMRPPVDQATYRRRAQAVFEAKPPVVWAALSNGQLAGYVTSYATGSEATLETAYISPSFRDNRVGLGLYWLTVTGWARASGVRNVWAGGTMPGGIDDFKTSIGAVLEHVPVHSGMRGAIRLGYRVLKPDALSLKDLHA